MNTGKVLGQWAPLTFYNSGGWVVCCGFLCAPNPVSLSHGEICCGPCKYLDIIVIVCLTSAPWVLSIVPLFDILYKPLLKFLLLELLFLCTYALGQMMMFTVYLMLFLLTSYNCFKRTGWKCFGHSLASTCLLLVASVPLLHVSDCPLLTESRSCVTRSENTEFLKTPVSFPSNQHFASMKNDADWICLWCIANVFAEDKSNKETLGMPLCQLLGQSHKDFSANELQHIVSCLESRRPDNEQHR